MSVHQSVCVCVHSLDKHGKEVTSGMLREDYKTVKEPSEAEEDLSKSMELFLCYSSQETPPSSKQAIQLENIFRFLEDFQFAAKQLRKHTFRKVSLMTVSSLRSIPKITNPTTP